MNSRSTSLNMNAYGARQTPRLQNTQKPALGGGWGAAGAPGTVPMQNQFGGLGGMPARPSQLSGFAQVMGGGAAGQGPIDMSDFPSLSGGPRQSQNSGSSAAGWNSNTIRQPPSQPQQTQQQQQQPPPSSQQPRPSSTAPSQHSIEQYDSQRSSLPSTEQTGRGDDFPPLGGHASGDNSTLQSNGYSGGIGSPEGGSRQASGQQTQLPIRQSNGTYGTNPQGGPAQPSQFSQTQQQQQQQPMRNGQPPPPAAAPANVKQYGDMTENEKWGMPGLIAALEARRQAENDGQVDETLPPIMRSAIIMGQDLNDLGLNLESPESLYPTFTPFPAISSSGSAFDFHDRHVVPDFTLPSAYTVTNVPPLSSRMSAFSDETLFSIFYQSPRDIAQELAAQELTLREWRWHKIIRQWLQKDTRESNTGSSLPLVDLANGAPIGAPPVRVGDRSERGIYIFFDAMNWRRERREFVLDYEQLDHHRAPPAAAGIGAGAAPVQNGVLGAAQPQQQPAQQMASS